MTQWKLASIGGLQFDAINDSLPEWKEHFGTSPRKIGADEYWDDKAKVVKNGELIDNADA